MIFVIIDNFKLWVRLDMNNTIEYIVFKYFGIGGGAGYRLMFVGNKQLRDNFTAPVYLIKARFFFGDVLKDVM